MADLDAELGSRLARLAESVPVAPWLGHVAPSPVAARQRVRMAWLTPVLAVVALSVVLLGRDVLWNAGWPTPSDGPIELWTARLSEGEVCPAARGGGILVRHQRSGLGVTDVSGGLRSAVKWPAGYSARIEQGRAVLMGPGGRIMAREGDHLEFGGAGGRDADGTEYFYACFGIRVVANENEPTDAPTTEPSPDEVAVVGIETHGSYTVELRSERAFYHESDLIQVTATFTYAGDLANAVQGFKAGFGVVEPVYGISMQPAYTMECNHTTFEPGEQFVSPFQKSGGVSGSDPQHDAKLAYILDPELRLPPGTWHLQYHAFWNEDECGSETTSLTAEIEIEVVPDEAGQVVLRTAATPNASGLCRTARGSGTLAANPRTGLGFENGGSLTDVIWPFGWTARRDGEDVVLINNDGEEVARTGEHVEFAGGYISNDDTFTICGMP